MSWSSVWTGYRSPSSSPDPQNWKLPLPPTCKKIRTRCGVPFHKRLLLGCSPPFIRLAEHLTVLRAWWTRCRPGRRKPDICHAPSRQCRGARVIPYRVEYLLLVCRMVLTLQLCMKLVPPPPNFLCSCCSAEKLPPLPPYLCGY